MKRKQLKFVVGSLVILLTLTWLGFSGFRESRAYFQTVSELVADKDSFYDTRMRVKGEVVPGTIIREDKLVKFEIVEQNQKLTVHYMGSDPLPDTFRDYAEAVAEGQYGRDGIFVANKLQAKCASKYEREQEAGVTPTKAKATEY